MALLDKAVEPTTYRCAVVSQPELAQLRRVKDIVRRGRLQAIEPARLVLDGGVLDADPDTLYIDCSASASASASAITVPTLAAASRTQRLADEVQVERPGSDVARCGA